MGCRNDNIGYFIPWYFFRQWETIFPMARPSPRYSGDESLVALGNAIREARMMLGLSQEALAVDADLDRSYVGGVERGEHNITVMNLKRIAAALSTEASTLLVSAKL